MHSRLSSPLLSCPSHHYMHAGGRLSREPYHAAMMGLSCFLVCVSCAQMMQSSEEAATAILLQVAVGSDTVAQAALLARLHLQEMP